MSNYTKTTDFEAKDSLPTGDSGKIIRGAEFETEFDAISTAIATKADTSGPTFTGTLTFETISDGTIGVTAFVDEDDMSSDSATLVPTQQSVKAYVDAQVTAQDLAFQADSGGALSIDLDSETLTFTGGTGIDTSGALNAVTFAIDSTVATLTGTQTLTNKTLTSPDVNTPDIDGGTIDGATIATSDITVGTGKTLDVSSGTLTLADNQISGDKVEGGTIASTTITSLASTTVDTTNVEVTNIKAKDGTSAGSIADTTGVVTLASSVLTTTDINGGTIDGATIGATTAAAGSFTTVSATGNITVDGTVDGRDVAADGTKLDGIESGATADQTAAEIRTLVDSATDSNVFTDADHTKLDGVEANATADQTAAEIRTLVDSATDSNVFTDADHTKLDGIETGATADQTDAEIRAAVEAATDSNVFTDADHTKLDGIEAGADVTDTTNVTAAGALMDSELTNITAVKALDQGVATTDSPTFVGLTTTADVSFGDNDKAVFGDGSDLQIFHSGTHSYISDAGTGDLKLYGINVEIGNNSGVKSFVAQSGGASKVYYNGAEKLATTATGIDVTGTVTADGLTVDGATSTLKSGSSSSALIIKDAGDSQATIQFGSTNNYKMQGGSDYLGFNLLANGTTVAKFATGGDISFYEDTGTTAKFFWDASEERLGIGTSSPAKTLDVRTSNGSDSVIRVGSSNSIGINVNVGTIEFYSADPDDAGVKASIANYVTGNQGPGGSVDGNLIFSTTDSDGGGNDSPTERMRIDSSGNVGIGTDNPLGKLAVEDSGTGSEIVLSRVGAAAGLYARVGWTGANGLDIGVDNGNVLSASHITMSVDGSEAIRIDSSGNVGIGNAVASTIDSSSGLGNLVVGSGSGNEGITIYTGSSSYGGLNFADATSGGGSYAGYIKFDHADNSFGHFIGNTERMRIDSSGNLLVGTTDTTLYNNTTGNGFMVFGSGGVHVAKESSGATDPALLLNNTGDDGQVIRIAKDGSTVGSIGVGNGSSYIYIGTGDTGIMTNSGNDYIQPWNPSGNTTRDNAISLGNASNRFKDLYLSGGAYLGGTAAANHLDDYEEGTWTPTLIGAASGSITTFSITRAVYTKIGNRVFLDLSLTGIDVSGSTIVGACRIGGIPFTASGNLISSGSCSRTTIFTADVADISVNALGLTTAIELYQGSSSTTYAGGSLDTSVTSGALRMSISYEAA